MSAKLLHTRHCTSEQSIPPRQPTDRSSASLDPRSFYPTSDLAFHQPALSQSTGSSQSGFHGGSGSHSSSTTGGSTANSSGGAASKSTTASGGSKGGINKAATDNRANQLNPNNQSVQDNRANQVNPNNAATKRGGSS